MEKKNTTKKSQLFKSGLFFAMLFTSILFLAGQATSFASTVALQWDPNTESDLAGYKVYYQADSATIPFQGTAPVDVLNQTTATIDGLDPNYSYYFAVTAYNTSGAESSYSNIVAVPEMASPTISLSYPANNASVSGTVSVSANASDNVGVTKVEYYVNGTLQAADTSTPYVYSWDTTTIAAGSYMLMTKAYDAAGNVGQSENVAVTVVNDFTAPTVSMTSPANNATVSGTVMISASASDNVTVSRVEFYENGVLLAASNMAPYSHSWDTTAVANNSYVLTAKAYDAAGNVSQSSNVSVIVFNDTTAPAVSISSPLANATVSGTIMVSAAASDNAGVTKVEFFVNDTLQTADTTSPYTFSWNTKSVENGTYTLTSRAYDAAGNAGVSSPVILNVNNDTTPPTVSIISPIANAILKGTVNISANASDNVKISKVEFYQNGVLKRTDTLVPYTYNWTTTSSADGIYSLTVKAYDAAGNTGSSTVAVSVKNDTTAPTVSITSPLKNATVSGTKTVTASTFDKVGVKKVEFYVNGVLQATDTASPWSFRWDTTSLTNGIYSLSARAYDASGNVGQSSNISVTAFNN
jgi:uncharacterized protein involved in tellurium resistance